MPKTLLLADDSVTIQKVVGLSFASEDVVLITVSNGDDALARARELRPDLVLADVVMPGRNGYEVCEAIKSDPALRHVPVLLLTGTFEAFDQERARRAGADGHVTKPFEAQALVAQVRELMARGERPAAPPVAEPPVVAPIFEDDLQASAAESALELGPDDAAAAHVELAAVAEDEVDDLLAPTELGVPAAEIFEVGQESFRGTPVFAPTTESDLLSPRAIAPEPAGLLPEEDFDLGFDEPPFPITDPAATHSAPPVPASDFGRSDPATDSLLDPGIVGDYDLSFSDLDDPLAATRGESASTAPSPPGAATPTQPDLAPRPATSGAGLSVDLSPVMRERLHDTLEKVAWEAFADLSDTIVRQALERIERIAWEVIPQMAEQLVREEIRRMKDDGEDA
ncbi:MAG: response regulator [Deltaproteobacteria bacterium]|nr:response regulator [Deltaproteobacteria bacterium]